MPEGDTVFRTADSLRQALQGRVLTRCDVRVPQHATVDLTGQTVDEVLSRGKHLFIRVGPASIHSHLKMDGSWQIGRVRGAGHKVRIVLAAGAVTVVTTPGIVTSTLHVADPSTLYATDAAGHDTATGTLTA